MTIKELKEDFLKLIENGKLGHAYLFFGQGEEKFLFVRQLANYLENKEWEEPKKILLDAFLTQRGGDVNIEQAREIQSFLRRTPFYSKKRMAIIDIANEITLQAQNALLKIAEEPPANSLLVVCVDNPEVLLPTLVSRFQKIYVQGEVDKGRDLSLAKDFLKASLLRRKEILKKITQEDKEEENYKKQIEDFVAGLILELRRDKVKNWRALKELLTRWAVMGQYNTNKKLQLEAATNGL